MFKAFRISFSLALRTLSLLTQPHRVGGTASAAITPDWVPLVRGEQIAVVVDVLKAAFEVNLFEYRFSETVSLIVLQPNLRFNTLDAVFNALSSSLTLHSSIAGQHKRYDTVSHPAR